VGQKVHPTGFRLGIHEDWRARWYAKKSYGEQLLEDVKIRRYLKTRLGSADVAKIVIEKTGESVRLVIHTARPGVIIGKKGQSIEIFEIRPRWDDPQEIMENPVAKAVYVKTRGVWKIYWQRADLKWHGYEPYPEAKSLEEFLQVVESDEYACFFG